MFLARLVLAATLGANYGIYGRPYELLENRPFAPGSEEYRDSEKYEIKAWDRDRADTLSEFIGLVNRIRRQEPALQRDDTLRFVDTDNDTLIAYTKSTPDGEQHVLTVVCLDPHWAQSGYVLLPLAALDLEPTQPYQMHDLLTNARYVWRGERNYVSLDPHVCPAHVFRIRRPLAGTDRFA
jgi:starch synthase (maltosyl-transferring)